MRRNYIREKKILCGDSYMAVGLYAITPQEHKARGKKQKESSTDQKSRNKMSSLRQKQRKAIANFDKYGFSSREPSKKHFCQTTFWPASGKS